MNRAEEARLLYTLLDAAEAEARLRDPSVAKKWHALKQRFDNARAEKELDALESLLDELDRGGALVGTWIAARWSAAKARRVSGVTSRKAPRPGSPLRTER